MLLLLLCALTPIHAGDAEAYNNLFCSTVTLDFHVHVVVTVGCNDMAAGKFTLRHHEATR